MKPTTRKALIIIAILLAVAGIAWFLVDGMTANLKPL